MIELNTGFSCGTMHCLSLSFESIMSDLFRFSYFIYCISSVLFSIESSDPLIDKGESYLNKRNSEIHFDLSSVVNKCTVVSNYVDIQFTLVSIKIRELYLFYPANKLILKFKLLICGAGGVAPNI